MYNHHQSADCERLVSAHNTVKTNSRSRLERETISNYLYVNINMTTILSKFDPRPAVRHRELISFTFLVNGKRQGRNFLTVFSCNLYVLDFLS